MNALSCICVCVAMVCVTALALCGHSDATVIGVIVSLAIQLLTLGKTHTVAVRVNGHMTRLIEAVTHSSIEGATDSVRGDTQREHREG